MEKQIAGEAISQGRPGAAVVCVLCAKSLQSVVSDSATLWTDCCWPVSSMGFSRQEY